jgi:hypothetical protein
MFYDFERNETFSEIKTEGLGLSAYQDVWSPSLNNHNHNNNNNNTYNNYKNQDIKGHFDTDDFPMTVFDIEEVMEEMIEVENIKIEKTENINILEAEEVIQTLIVPVIVAAKEEKYLSYKSDSEESDESENSEGSECSDHSISSSLSLTEDDDSPAEDPKCWPTRARRQPRRRYTTEESDADWQPEEEEEQPVRKKSGKSGGRRKPSRYEREIQRPPVPQRRKSGTKKITQWILSLLRDPDYNPRVISWDNEEKGVFYITDTAKFAKLWGMRKKNPSMNYEKLSRAMRYYYKNGELIAVDKRTTYQFGSKSDYLRTSKE